MKIIEKHLPSGKCYNPNNALLNPKGIVIHHISNINRDKINHYDADVVRNIFIEYGVSAHYQINRDGSVWELVPEGIQSWHAGKSKFKNLISLNSYTLGYEFVGSEFDEFTDEQYISGAELITKHMKQYKNINTSTIVGHEIVSDERVRSDPKHDPGQYFDWLRLGAEISKQQKNKKFSFF